MTPDPYTASGGPASPESWNRYAYTRGDPVNRFDPAGLDNCSPDEPACWDPWPTNPQPNPCSGFGPGGCPGDPNPDPDPQPTPTPAPPAQPSQPAGQCAVEFGTVPPISAYLPGLHTFFYVENSDGTWDVIDGGPEFGPSGKLIWKTVHVGRGRWGRTFTEPFLTWGTLITADNSTGLYKENTNPNRNIYWQYQGSNTCQLVEELAGLAADLNGVTNYGFPSPNSNSFTYTLDQDLNLNIPAPPITAVGWGTLIP